MDPIQRFAAYAADFEKTYQDDDWKRLEGYFAEDVVYAVKGDVPFACEVRGREAIFRAIKKCLDGFDRRFDTRELAAEGAPEVEGNRVTFRGTGRYERPGVEPVSMRLSETVELNDAGLIVRLTDVYPPGQDEALAWIERHGGEFDISYV